MILSWQIPGYDAYRTVALALMETERDIASRQHSKHKPDRDILPSLILKRDRLRCEVQPLKAAVEAAEREALERMTATTPVRQTGNLSATTKHAGGEHLDIPEFLRRQS